MWTRHILKGIFCWGENPLKVKCNTNINISAYFGFCVSLHHSILIARQLLTTVIYQGIPFPYIHERSLKSSHFPPLPFSSLVPCNKTASCLWRLPAEGFRKLSAVQIEDFSEYFVQLYLAAYICCLAKLHSTFCDPMDCSLSGSSAHVISQARIMEWFAISFSRGSSWTSDQIRVSCICRQILYHWATREAQISTGKPYICCCC